MIFNMIAKGSGGSPAISVVDTPDSGGGTVRTITALDISDTTATASDVASGKYFYTAAGVKTVGSASGGAFGLIDTITVSENSRAVNIDFTSYYANYDAIIVYFDTVEVGPSSDWIYFVQNTSTPSGGDYTDKLSSFKGIAIFTAAFSGFSNKPSNSASGLHYLTRTDESTTLQNMLVYTYDASKYIKAGSVMKVYGCNYVNL